MDNNDVFNIVLTGKIYGGGSPAPTPTYQEKTLTPDFSNGTVSITSDEGYDALSQVNIEKDSNLIAGNIKKNVVVHGITGSYEGSPVPSNEDAIIDRSITSISNSSVTSIGGHAFYGCGELVSVDFPNATSIGTSAFQSCTKLTSVNFPNVTSISTSAFQSCPITSLDFPNVTSISANALQFCTKLTSVNFPKITSIGASAFANCPAFNSLTLGSSTMCTLANVNAFANTPFAANKAGGTIYVPSELVTTYQADSVWAQVLAQNANNKILAIPSE